MYVFFLLPPLNQAQSKVCSVVEISRVRQQYAHRGTVSHQCRDRQTATRCKHRRTLLQCHCGYSIALVRKILEPAGGEYKRTQTTTTTKIHRPYSNVTKPLQTGLGNVPGWRVQNRKKTDANTHPTEPNPRSTRGRSASLEAFPLGTL